MNSLDIIMPVYEMGIIALALGTALHLGRRGAGAHAIALAPVALAQMVRLGARLALPLTSELAWVWLAQTAANAALIYALWQAGNLALALRCAPEAPEEKPVELARIRAVASWPGRRSAQ